MPQDVAVESGEDVAMPRLLTGARLRTAVEEGTFIKDGVPSSVEAVKYDFHLGTRVLKACFRQPKDIDSIPEENRQVDPGEAVFVLTSERLDLPRNMIAILAPKRKLAHDGIIMLGGLAVDPLYKGHLLIGLYNFSSTPFPLLPGRKLIGAAFYELDKNEVGDFESADPTEITDFPDELIRLIQNYRPIGLNGLEDQIVETRRQLDILRSDLTTDKQWREDFKESLNKHDQQLGTLI
ncbi:MAG: hypothetical protein K0M78_04720, partial [Brevundimonas sp.]|nr:hypothetical protein [Brevundimonas sp.]